MVLTPSLLLFYHTFIAISHMSNGQEYREFHGIEQTSANVSMLTSDLLVQATDSKLMGCMKACVVHPNCFSFLYNAKLQLCRTFGNTARRTNENGLTGSDWTYYELLEGECPVGEDYIFDDATGLCVKPYTSKSTYMEAVVTCLNERARLVRLDSEMKWEAIKSILYSIPFSLFYVQGSYVQDVLRYDNGDPVDFLKWTGSPPTADDSLRLIISKEDGYKWHSVDGSSYNGFICQKNVLSI